MVQISYAIKTGIRRDQSLFSQRKELSYEQALAPWEKKEASSNYTSGWGSSQDAAQEGGAGGTPRTDLQSANAAVGSAPPTAFFEDSVTRPGSRIRRFERFFSDILRTPASLLSTPHHFVIIEPRWK